jgi:CubicO group peptidase (beta-lactamase class C family)
MTGISSRTSWMHARWLMLAAIVLAAAMAEPLTPTAAEERTPVASASSSADTLQSKLARIDKLIADAHRQGIFRGNVLIAQGGPTIFDKSYGMAMIEWQRPLSSDVIFSLGSITKLFTSMTILKLAQDGKLSLDSTITDYLPYYRKDTGTKITIAQLLDHSSGLPDFTTDPQFPDVISRLKIPVKEFIIKYGERDLLFPPGTSYYYSNTGYFILGAIIESVTGTSYGESLTSIIFKPLGMTSSGYRQNALVLPKAAGGYVWEGCRESVAPFAEMSVPYSAGAVYSTVGDLQKFYQGILANTVLDAHSTELMLQPHIKEPATFEGNPIYSTFGWDRLEMHVLNSSTNDKIVVHSKSGVINGFVNLVLMTDKYFIVALSNSQDSYTANIALGALNILYGLPVQPVEKSTLTQMREAICTSGTAAAINFYEKQRATLPSQSFSEGTLSALGQNFIGIDLNIDVTLEDIDRALALFQLNAKYFPETTGVYTDLATGNTIKASHMPATLKAGN